MNSEKQVERIKDFLNQYDFGIVLCTNMENDTTNSLIINIRDDPYFSRFLIKPSTEKLEKTARTMKKGEVAVIITDNFKSGFKTILNELGIRGLVLCTKASIPMRIAHLIIR